MRSRSARTFDAPADFRHVLAVAAQDDGFVAFLDSPDQLRQPGFGVVHVDGNHVS